MPHNTPISYHISHNNLDIANFLYSRKAILDPDCPQAKNFKLRREQTRIAVYHLFCGI